ncbi:hypothetical protein M404DRAFT_754654 [Pisolithus tinctorius Marx 270]|uniref:Uncharacterized protein n=1 Tax=Pisolithus tinctorius Marx 270 TaxID=870435 RepID=A0A0C3NZN9_PISTI|nr:hypothetical protein M404DRAFT_754654 [Pisolithus tinctorius Marx 270]
MLIPVQLLLSRVPSSIPNYTALYLNGPCQYPPQRDPDRCRDHYRGDCRYRNAWYTLRKRISETLRSWSVGSFIALQDSHNATHQQLSSFTSTCRMSNIFLSASALSCLITTLRTPLFPIRLPTAPIHSQTPRTTGRGASRLLVCRHRNHVPQGLSCKRSLLSRGNR